MFLFFLVTFSAITVALLSLVCEVVNGPPRQLTLGMLWRCGDCLERVAVVAVVMLEAVVEVVVLVGCLPPTTTCRPKSS